MAGIPKLIILSEQFRGRTFELTKDQHTVGRVDERDICIKDPTVSTYHCRFIKSGNTYILEDQGSTNGTRVNNVPIMSQPLQNSDILQIGGVEILYDCDDKSVTTVVQQQVTKTDIDIVAGTGQTQQMRRLAEKGFTKRSRSNNTQKFMLLIIVVLALLVLGLLVFLVYSMKKTDVPLESSSDIETKPMITVQSDTPAVPQS